MQMVPSLNATIDIVTTREASRRSVVPRLVLSVLICLTVVSAFSFRLRSKHHERNNALLCFCPHDNTCTYLVIDLIVRDRDY
jgi:hypothetical protein